MGMIPPNIPGRDKEPFSWAALGFVTLFCAAMFPLCYWMAWTLIAIRVTGHQW